jgi:hypothetical protein
MRGLDMNGDGYPDDKTLFIIPGPKYAFSNNPIIESIIDSYNRNPLGVLNKVVVIYGNTREEIGRNVENALKEPHNPTIDKPIQLPRVLKCHSQQFTFDPSGCREKYDMEVFINGAPYLHKSIHESGSDRIEFELSGSNLKEGLNSIYIKATDPTNPSLTTGYCFEITLEECTTGEGANGGGQTGNGGGCPGGRGGGHSG